MDNWKEIVCLVALAGLVLLLRGFGKSRGGNTRSAILMKKYAVISPEVFDRIPQDELVDAVVSRVLARASKQRRPDPEKVLAELPHGNVTVYSVWAVCKEMVAADYTALTKTATRDMVEPAIAAFGDIGADQCAAALTELHRAHSAGEDTQPAEEAFHHAVETQCPLSLCEDYIRDHKEDFIDRDEE